MKRIIKVGAITSLLIMLFGCGSLSNNNFSGYFQSNDELKTSVESAFYENKILNGTPITVQAQNGQVSLSGYVKTIRQSDTAEEIAAKVNGVKVVHNELIVRK